VNIDKTPLAGTASRTPDMSPALINDGARVANGLETRRYVYHILFRFRIRVNPTIKASKCMYVHM